MMFQRAGFCVCVCKPLAVKNQNHEFSQVPAQRRGLHVTLALERSSDVPASNMFQTVTSGHWVWAFSSWPQA